MSETARVVAIPRHGGPEVLRVEERPLPDLGPDDVRIDVRSAGVNFADLLARMGMYPGAPDPPCVPGLELAGVVSAVGDAVADRTIGERVLASTNWGGYADRVVLPAVDAVPLPPNVDFDQGTAMPVNYSTAWSAIVDYGNVRPGQRVLIHAAAGGVGTAAVQIARLRGAEVFGTSSPQKHAALREHGVDHPVDYTREGWDDGLPPMDVVLDGVGGDSFKRSYDLLTAGGRLVIIGSASLLSGELRSTRFNAVRLMTDAKSVIGINGLHVWRSHGSLARWTEPLYPLLADGTLVPVIADRIPFERAGDAHRLIAERRNVGKVVLRP